MRTTEMGKDHCPACNKTLDKASDIKGDKVPLPGDLSVCIGCAAYLTYSNDMALRLLTQFEIQNLKEEERCALIELRTLIRLRHSRATIFNSNKP